MANRTAPSSLNNDSAAFGDDAPSMSPVGSDEEGSSVYDSEEGLENSSEIDDEDSGSGEDEEEDDFEDQGSSDEDEDRLAQQGDEDESDDEIALEYESVSRSWSKLGKKRSSSGGIQQSEKSGEISRSATAFVHTDDLSSDDDDEDGTGNRIGRVPIHWYEEYEHVGYDAHGEKVVKSASVAGDRIGEALSLQDNMAKGKYVIHDALNDRNVELTERQLELIRRVQGGAFAHPEHDANPDHIDYFSGVDPIISGLNSNKHEPKARFQPSKWEKLQVERLLDRLSKGYINMDYLTGKIRDMNDVHKKNRDPDKPYTIWSNEDEDELNMRKGPQHISAPKMAPPGHASSYIPPDEYLPTPEDLEQWKEMPVKDRPHGLMIPKKFPNLRSVGAYQNSVREAFERCLDLYLCPRIMKRRLNIDPESLVPRLPRAQDLKPFPTAKCVEYETPHEEGSDKPSIRCVSPSPDGQFVASGAADGYVRLWEVQTGRLLRSWNIAATVSDFDIEQIGDKDDADTTNGVPKPVVCLEWNPNRSHHCMLAAIGRFVVVIATGTAGQNDAELTEALLNSAARGGNVIETSRASKAVQWLPVKPNDDRPISHADRLIGPVCVLRTNRDITSVRWQSKGDYFVSVSPKAGPSAILIHQLSKENTQQPFSKAKGETQLACFHPTKPFLYVASQQHVRIYHLVKQTMAKRLASGCRWISSLDVHPSGDHLIVGSLDRRVIWFDLDLGATPYKTLKYHERAVRSCRFHNRYPLMASASDDGAVHVFHSMVYSDLMRNPLIVPVKVLHGHAVTNKLGVLTTSFHPTQPWLFTGGADGRIFLYQDI